MVLYEVEEYVEVFGDGSIDLGVGSGFVDVMVMEFVLGGEYGGVWKVGVIDGKGLGGVCVGSLENIDFYGEWFGINFVVWLEIVEEEYVCMKEVVFVFEIGRWLGKLIECYVCICIL